MTSRVAYALGVITGSLGIALGTFVGRYLAGKTI